MVNKTLTSILPLPLFAPLGDAFPERFVINLGEDRRMEFRVFDGYIYTDEGECLLCR